MKSEKVFYKDEKAVKVTETLLQVKTRFYNLKGITRHGFTIMQPDALCGADKMAASQS